MKQFAITCAYALLLSSLGLTLVMAQQNQLHSSEADLDERWLKLLREGLAGDTEKFDEIEELCDTNIASSQHTLFSKAWKAAALTASSSRFFQSGKLQAGLERWNAALKLIDEADQPEASPFVRKRVATVCLRAWRHEQDDERKKKIATRGVAALTALHASGNQAWTKLGNAGKLHLLLNGVNAAFGADDSDSASSFVEVMESISADAEDTLAARKILKSGKSQQNPIVAGQRFDELVREDFFDGIFAKDKVAFDRAMKVCREKLKADPKHYEAMVWLGSGMLYEAGEAYDAGDEKKGKDIWNKGLSKMHTACAAKPDDISVLIPRAATIVGIGRIVSLAESDRMALLNLAVYDYERTLQIQKPYFDKLSAHAKSELLFGLADGWHQLGNKSRSNRYFGQVVKNDPDGENAELAQLFLQGKGATSALKHRNCVSCH